MEGTHRAEPPPGVERIQAGHGKDNGHRACGDMVSASKGRARVPESPAPRPHRLGNHDSIRVRTYNGRSGVLMRLTGEHGKRLEGEGQKSGG